MAVWYVEFSALTTLGQALLTRMEIIRSAMNPWSALPSLRRVLSATARGLSAFLSAVDFLSNNYDYYDPNDLLLEILLSSENVLRVLGGIVLLPPFFAYGRAMYQGIPDIDPNYPVLIAHLPSERMMASRVGFILHLLAHIIDTGFSQLNRRETPFGTIGYFPLDNNGISVDSNGRQIRYSRDSIPGSQNIEFKQWAIKPNQSSARVFRASR